MTPQELKNSILQLAIQGKLVEQRPEEGTAEELYQQIQVEKQRLIAEGKIKKEKPLPEITEEEKPFDIPESWKLFRLGELITLLSGTDFPPERYNDKGLGTPYITGASSLHENGVLLNRWTETPSIIAESGDVLLVCKGSGYGKTVICDIVEAHIARQIMAIKHSTLVDMNYIRYYLQANLTAIKANGQGVIPGIDRSSVLNMAFPLPPLAEQQRIVAKIEELLPLIDWYEKAWSRLEEFNKQFPGDLQKSILQMAIQGKLVEQRPEEGTGEELYQKIQAEKQKLIKEGKIKKEKPLPEIKEEEKPFDIPESWKWVSVGSVCTNIQYGSSSKSSLSGKIPVLRMGNIQNGKIVYDKLVYTSDESEISKYPLLYNDLLFNRTNSKELVGKTAIYKAETPAIYAGYLVRLTPVSMDSDYLNFTMQTQYYWNYCQTVRSDAIGQSNINAEKLKRFVFPLPPLAEQKRIVARLEELLPLCEALKS